MGACATIFIILAILIILASVFYYFYFYRRKRASCCTGREEEIQPYDFVYGEFTVPGGHWFGGEVGEKVPVLLHGNVCDAIENCYIDVTWFEGWNMNEPIYHVVGDKISADDEEDIFGLCDLDPLEDWSKWGDTGGVKSTIQSRNICMREHNVRLS